MPIGYDDRELIDEVASSAKAKAEAKKKAKAEQKAQKKAQKAAEKAQRKANRDQAIIDFGDKIADTPLGRGLDYLSDLTLGTDWHSNIPKPELDMSANDGTDPDPVSGSDAGSGSGNKRRGSGFGSGSFGSGIGSGTVAAANDPYAALIKEINKTVQANNEWSAQQAQKQMDFQLMMSNTAHQREIADLQAAGLNPVLSAGGSGASTASGAMAQTDTSNSRLIAEVSMEAINAVANTAAGVSRSRTKKAELAQKATQSIWSKLGTSAASGIARSLGYAIGRGLFGGF